MRYPAFLIAISLGLGLALADGYPILRQHSLAAGALSALLGLAAAFASTRVRRVSLPLSLAFLFACAGSALAIPEPAPRPTVLLSERELLRFEGKVVDPPQRAYGSTHLVVSVSRVHARGEWRPVRSLVRLFVGGLVHHVTLGDEIVGRARFGSPRILDNPGSAALARQLRYAGVAAVGSMRSGAALVRRADVVPAGLWPALDRERAAVAARLGTGVLGEGALVAAMFLGDRGNLTKVDREAFAVAGLSHALAVSGQHLVVVVFILYKLLAWVLARWSWFAIRLSPRRASAVLALALAVVYTLFTGAPYSAVRALVMAGLYLGATLMSRSSRAGDALCLGAAAILVAVPGALFDVGFQLSILAVAGLHLVTPHVRAWLLPKALEALAGVSPPTTLWRRAWMLTARLLAATLGASAITAPLIAFHFQYFTPLGLLGSLFVVPFLEAWVLPIASLAAALPWFGDALWPTAEVGAWLMRRALDGLLTLEGVATSVPPPSILQVVLLVALVVALPHVRRRAMRVTALALAGIFIFTIARAAIERRLDDNLRITFLSVGHGDAAVVQLPGNRALLIDGGGAIHGDFDIGRFVVAPALRALGVSRLDVVILSHMHPDHAEGLGHVLRHFDVGELWHNGRPFGRGARAVASALAVRPVRERTFREGEPPLRLGAASIEVLHPLLRADEPEPYYRELGENDNSVAVRIRFGAFSALFTGDLEGEGEKIVTRAHPDLRATVLKSPHHGSRTSSTPRFLAAVDPEVVVFSVGENNTFGFPHADVQERTRATGAYLFRTDLDGAVSVTTDGKRVELAGRRSRRKLRFDLSRSIKQVVPVAGTSLAPQLPAYLEAWRIPAPSPGAQRTPAAADTVRTPTKENLR